MPCKNLFTNLLQRRSRFICY